MRSQRRGVQETAKPNTKGRGHHHCLSSLLRETYQLRWSSYQILIYSKDSNWSTADLSILGTVWYVLAS